MNNKPLSQALNALKNAAESTGSEMQEALQQGMEQIGISQDPKREREALIPHKIAEETETEGRIMQVRKQLQAERFQTAQSLGTPTAQQEISPSKDQDLQNQHPGIPSIRENLTNQPKVVQLAVGASNRRDSKRSAA